MSAVLFWGKKASGTAEPIMWAAPMMSDRPILRLAHKRRAPGGRAKGRTNRAELLAIFGYEDTA